MGMRIEGWEGRLAAVIEDARARPYALGEHDCFSVACAAVHALTGADLWPEWAGRYRTKREALRLIADYGNDFTGAFSRLFGCDPVPTLLALRGDIVEFFDNEAHLGVCLGIEAAVLGAAGLRFVPLHACSHCWRIG